MVTVLRALKVGQKNTYYCASGSQRAHLTKEQLIRLVKDKKVSNAGLETTSEGREIIRIKGTILVVKCDKDMNVISTSGQLPPGYETEVTAPLIQVSKNSNISQTLDIKPEDANMKGLSDKNKEKLGNIINTALAYKSENTKLKSDFKKIQNASIEGGEVQQSEEIKKLKDQIKQLQETKDQEESEQVKQLKSEIKQLKEIGSQGNFDISAIQQDIDRIGESIRKNESNYKDEIDALVAKCDTQLSVYEDYIKVIYGLLAQLMKVCYQNFDTDIHGDASDDFNRWCSEFRTDAKSMQEVTDQLEDDLRWIRTLADDTKTEINTIRIQEQLDRIEKKLIDVEDTKSDFEKAKQKIDDSEREQWLRVYAN